ncbi:hypothetical protein DICPUDRAFT_92218 [Dictyostelium purpureum]|uniref:Proteasome maturation factor UMP1 family protein n=1 Tax=Dictyostelium purpureum TaxID=5786 RepID=F0ZNM9_DICPU|nr:uncharacterized protein DICPUDRAFT_92218 [Dictyostelium purpureum]EGC34438.1 hypothetical protein DICPUDRAFT_92218 [Dictyostelium purpureum]|eukprot:XP_003289023.1 hypothetical protein DICPUDRAFT_92218 [Dictyostelium purpureum]
MENIVQKDLDLPVLRNEVSNTKGLAHPVQAIQLDQGKTDEKLKYFAMKNVFGSHMTLNNEIEKQIYSQYKRLPTLPSSMIALETHLGLDEDFDFSDYLSDPLLSAIPTPQLHQTMEQKLGIAMPKNFM